MGLKCESECWEKVKWRCEEGGLSEKRNLLVAAIAGAMFFTGTQISPNFPLSPYPKT